MPKSIVVTIKATVPVLVISEKIGDRERHENGVDQLDAEQEMDFIVHSAQSLRIEPVPEPEPVVIEDQAPVAAAKKGKA